MRVNIELDDETVRQAMELTGTPTESAVVALALNELVRRYSRHSLGELKGQVMFADSYDHKTLRVGNAQ